MDLLTDELGDHVTVLLVLARILHHLLRRHKLTEPLALRVEEDQVTEERLCPLLALRLLDNRLINRLLIRKTGISYELAQKVDDNQPTPRASILRIDLRLLVTRQIETGLEIEVQHLL